MMTQAPEGDIPLGEIVAEGLFIFGLVGVAVAIVIGFVTWMLLKAADKPPGSMVTLTLALLSIFAIGAYLVTRAEVMATIIGTAIGALAGAVTYQLAGGKTDAPASSDVESRPTNPHRDPGGQADPPGEEGRGEGGEEQEGDSL